MAAGGYLSGGKGGISGYADKGITAMSNAEEKARQEVQEALLNKADIDKMKESFKKVKEFFPPLTPKDYIVSDKEYRRLKDLRRCNGRR